MKKLMLIISVSVISLFTVSGFAADTENAAKNYIWAPHDMNRPQPTVVSAENGKAPSDAIILFGSKNKSILSGIFGGNEPNLSMWTWGEEAKWKVKNGYVEVGGKGDIKTKKEFGNVQLHVEFATPAPESNDKGQHRGNSGVFMMGKYEIQILDSYKNITYADGAIGALYGQVPPLVNACRKPGEWQSYDIIFHVPQFDKSGNVVRPATAMIFLNSVLVQDNSEFHGLTVHGKHAVYKAHGEKGPIVLQNHDFKVRFRNIWVRELPEPQKDYK